VANGHDDEVDDPNEYRDLGRMVSKVRELEFYAYEIVRAVGVFEPLRRGATGVLKEAKRQIAKGLPPWSRDVEPGVVTEWIDAVLRVLDVRNRYVHAAAVSMWDGDDWMPQRWSQRDLTSFEYSPGELHDTAARAHDLRDVARLALPRLLLHYRDRLFMHHPSTLYHGYAGVWTMADENDEVENVSEDLAEEMNQWLLHFLDSAPPGWSTWFVDRYAAQRRRTRTSGDDPS
jgi:hypothetical protein